MARMMRRALLVLLAGALLGGCASNRPKPNGGGESVLCPNGSVNAGMTIRTVNCSTVVSFDGKEIEGSLALKELVSAGMKSADTVLREIDQAASDAQIQFTQLCETYNACNLRSEDFDARLKEAQDHFRAIRERLELVRAAQGNPELLRQAVGDLYAAVVPPARQAEAQVAMELVVQAKTTGGATRVLRGGETLHTGDQLVFGVRVSQPAHVYAFQRKGPNAVLDVLFPNPQIATLGNPIPGLQLVRIPPTGQVFTLDDQDLGRETVYIAVSKTALTDLDAALRGVSTGGADAPKAVEQAVGDLFQQGSPECAGQPRGLEVTAEKGCGSMTRGLGVTPAAGTDDFFGDESSVAAQTRPGDDVILQTFSFVHER